MTPALLALYGAPAAFARNPATEAVQVMEPPPCRTMWGGSLGPDQGITREQAIRTVTINGAYTSFEENVKGSIEPGKYADFVVLSGDILTVPAERIKDLNVRATVLAGKTVYGDLATAAGP